MVPSKVTVPPGWIQSRFTELAVRNSSGQIPKAAKSTYQIRGRFPVVDQGQEMVAGYVDDEDLRFRGQLPIIVFGDHTRIFKYVDFPFVAGADGTRIITPRLDRLDASFFYYALCNLPLTNLGYSRHFKLLKEQMIQYPRCLHEQRKIAATLSSVDDAIEKTQAVVDQAQVVKRGLMQELLTRGLPGRHRQIQADRAREETGRDEPDGWRPAHLGDLARVNPEQLGSRTDPDHLLEYLDITSIERPGVFGSSRTFRFSEAPSRARRLARGGDILVSTVRPYLRNFALVREAPDNLVVSTGYAVIRPEGGVDGGFLYQHVLSDRFVEFLKPRMSGSNYPAVTADDVEAYPLFLPPLPEQRKIAAILSSVDDTIEENQTIMDRLRIFKTALMSTLLTGELRVTPAPEAA